MDPSTDRLGASVEVLSGATPLDDGPILSRSIHHPDLRRAEEHVLDVLRALPGLEVRELPLTATDVLDEQPVEVRGLRTIEATLPGVDPDLPPIVLGAHLDSTAKSTPGWQATTDAAPGADDDASGVAAVLELARLLTAWEPGYRRTVRFVLFTAEEVGLQGSFAYVDDEVDAVEFMLQLDPVGYNPQGVDRLWFAWDARWPELADAVDDAAAERGTWLTVQGVDAALIGGDARSDHYPFWEAGHPALHFGTFPPPPDYHEVTDTIGVVDVAFLGEVTGVLGAMVLPVLEPLDPPEDPPPTGCDCEGGSAAWLPLLLPWVVSRRRSAIG